MVMRTVISIDAISFPIGPGCPGSLRVDNENMITLMHACTKLLGRLGNLAERVEVIKITHSHGTFGLPRPEVRVVISLPGHEAKLEALSTIDLTYTGPRLSQWDRGDFTKKFISTMQRKIRTSLEIFAQKLDQQGQLLSALLSGF